MRRSVPVLLYHSVCTDPAPLMRDWTVTPATFRSHLEFLRNDGYETMTVSDYVAHVRAGASLPERLAIITFDDGFADFADTAAPMLADFEMRSTLYVSTAYVGATSSWLGPEGEQKMLTWTAIAELPALGVEVGAHAHHHLPLDELDPSRAQVEIVQSKNLIEHTLGQPIESFAYPHGYHSRALKDMVRLAGFTNACGVKNALSGPGDDLYALARFFVPAGATPSQLKELMAGLHRAPRYERVQTKAWRAVRRVRARRSPPVPFEHV